MQTDEPVSHNYRMYYTIDENFYATQIEMVGKRLCISKAIKSPKMKLGPKNIENSKKRTVIDAMK